MTPLEARSPATGDRRLAADGPEAELTEQVVAPAVAPSPSTNSAHEKCRPVTTAIAPVTPDHGDRASPSRRRCRSRADPPRCRPSTPRSRSPAAAHAWCAPVRDRGHAGTAGDADRPPPGPSRSSSDLLPELPRRVQTPASHRAVDHQRTRILRTGADRGDPRQIGHGDRDLGHRSRRRGFALPLASAPCCRAGPTC